MDFSQEELQEQAKALQQQLSTDHHPGFDAEYENESEEEVQEGRYSKFKKFVFKINPEYIDLIEQLSYDERHIFINEMLEDYIQRDREYEHTEKLTAKVKMVIFSIVFMIIGIPMLVWMFNMSLDATHDNYKDMQNNFIKLYKVRGKA